MFSGNRLQMLGERVAVLLLLLILLFFANRPCAARDDGAWTEGLDFSWGGHLKLRGTVSWPGEGTLIQPSGDRTFFDGNVEGRLKGRVFLGDWADFQAHYEVVLSGGDTRKESREIETDFAGEGFLVDRTPNDERRLLNLTKTLVDADTYTLYHRLDRLALTLRRPWGTVRIGRQVITWGNGLLFQVMDLFNPFSPSDIERDYKIGDDMITAQFPFHAMGDVQVLYIPRRDPRDGEVKWRESSLAGKLHFARGTTEFDLLAAKHFDDYVVGIGATGYLGGAAWRSDVTWTFLDHENPADGYLSLAANMDYSWVLWDRNVYGFVEFFYIGLGVRNYSLALTKQELVERLDRGELFTLGRPYLSGHIQLELHPLFNVFLTVINNVSDPSGIIQPRAVWDITQDMEITFGGTIFYGANDTEFGGFDLPGTGLESQPPNNVFLWWSYYF